MKHVVKHDYRDKHLPFTLYCGNKLIATALYGILLLGNEYCPICKKYIKAEYEQQGHN